MELSVDLLHLLVPAAEELDLLEQHEAEQLRLDDEQSSAAPVPVHVHEAPPVPTLAQAVAIVERYLGGSVVEG